MSQKHQELKASNAQEKQLEQQIRAQAAFPVEQSSNQHPEITIPPSNQKDRPQLSSADNKSQKQKQDETGTTSSSLMDRVRNFITVNQISLTESEVLALAQFLSGNNQSISMNSYEQWRQHNTKQSKSEANVRQDKFFEVKKQQSVKGQLKQSNNQDDKGSQLKNIKQQLSTSQSLNQFLSNQISKDSKEIKAKIVSAANQIVPSKLHIQAETIQKYLANGDEAHSLELFYSWLAMHEQEEIAFLRKQAIESETGNIIANQLQKIEQILQLINKEGSPLKISFGLGESKGKSLLRFGMDLRDTPKERFTITMDVKTKKKNQLTTFIENYLKKMYAATKYNIFKIFKYSIQQTQKYLKIMLNSAVLEESLLKSIIEKIECLYNSEQKLIFKVDVDLAFKNSIRSEQNRFQTKKLVKWMAEGFVANMKIEGNGKLVQHFTEPFSEFFPIFKAIKSGDVSLKMKNCQNIQKLFEKLGVNELAEQTPTLHEFTEFLLSNYLSQGFSVCLGDLVKNLFIFCGNLPNQRMICEISMNISHLNISMAISADSCRQLAECVSRQTIEAVSAEHL